MKKFSRLTKLIILFFLLCSVNTESYALGLKSYVNTSAKNFKAPALSSLYSLYARLNLDMMGLSQDAFYYAIKGFEQLRMSGKINNDKVITIIDFSQSSTRKRLFVIDLEKEQVLFNTHVAHGQQSGQEYAKKFSNTPESLQSSLGFYSTSVTYIGKHGYSMQLNGLEKNINDKANERAIVMHGADYVSEQLIRAQGYIGRSWGCPAIPQKLTKPIINAIKNGSCLFIYAPDKNYLMKSKLIFE